MLGKASSLLFFLFMQKSFCHGSFMPNNLAFSSHYPWQHLTSAELVWPRKVFVPQKAKSSGFILVLLHTLSVPLLCSESRCAHGGNQGHLLPSCLGRSSPASTVVTEALRGAMDFNQYPFLVRYCCRDGEFLNEVLWSVK